MILLLFSHSLTHAFESLSYSGRLVNSNGSPVPGNANLTFDLVYTNDLTNILCTKDMNGVSLSNGVFHVKLDFACPLETILASIPTGQSIAIRVTDRTPSIPKVYSYQSIHSLPFSFMSQLSRQLVQMGAADGQILTWDNTALKWVPKSPIGTGNGSVTEITAGTGLSGGTITTSGTIAIADGGVNTTQLTDSSVTSSKILDSTIVNADISPTANIAQSKIQNLVSDLAAKQDAVTSGSTAQYWRGDKSWQNLDASVRSALLFGYSIIPSVTGLSDGDTVQQALGKLEGQIIANDAAFDSTGQWGKSGALIYYTGGNVGIGTASPSVSLEVKGEIRLSGSTSGYVGLAPATAAGSTTYVLPSTDGTLGQTLTTNGSGVLSWSTSTTSPGGNDTEIQFNDAGNFGGSPLFTWNNTNTVLNLGGPTNVVQLTFRGSSSNEIVSYPSGEMRVINGGNLNFLTTNVGVGTTSPNEKLTVAGNLALTGKMRLKDSGTNYVELKSPTTIGSTVTYTLPGTLGTNGQALITDASGNLSWSTLATGSTAVGGDLSGSISSATINSGAVDSAKIADGSIVDADISASASIAQSKIANLSTSLAGKESTITAGDATKYWDGNKSWQDFNAAARAATLLGYGASAGTVATGDSLQTAVSKLDGNISAVYSAQANYVLKAGDSMTGPLSIVAPTADAHAANKLYVDTQTALSASKWTASGSEIFYNSGNVGVGTTTPTYKFHVVQNSNALTGNITNVSSSLSISPTANSSAIGVGVAGSVSKSSSFNIDRLWGGSFTASNQAGSASEVKGIIAYADGSGSNVTGVFGKASPSGTSPLVIGVDALAITETSAITAVTDMIGIKSNVTHTQLNTTTSKIKGVDVNVSHSAGSVTDAYGVYIGTVGSALTTNRYGLYSSDANAKSYFAGDVGIGTSVPQGKLDVKGTLLLSGATSGYVGLAPAAVAGSTIYTLPSADGSAGDLLKTNGAGVLSWQPPQSTTPTGTAGGDLSGTYPNPTISGLAATKISSGAIDDTEFSYLDGVSSNIQTQLNAKQTTIASGANTQYWRGDKTWQDFDAAARSALLFGYGISAGTVASGDSIQTAISKVDGNIAALQANGQWNKSGNDISYSAGRVGIGTSSPSLSSALEIASTTQGFLPPRMTEAQKNAIASPVVGLTIFNLSTFTLQIYDGSAWFSVGQTIPTGAVMAFAASTCPTGWNEYTPAYGRFLRGIDKSGTAIDPAGVRAAGSIQNQDWKGFSMTNTGMNTTAYSHGPVDMGKSTSSFVGNLFTGAWSAPAAATGVKWNAADEIRPKNTAVLYCTYAGTTAPLVPGANQMIEGNTEVRVSDTGSNGTIRMITEGVEALTVTSNGMVGIGTPAPSEKLSINDGTILLQQTSATIPSLYLMGASAQSIPTIKFFNPDNTVNKYIWYGPRDTSLLAVEGSSVAGDLGTEYFRVSETGDIGIGTMSPKNKVHIHASSGTPGIVLTNDANAVNQKGFRITNDNSRLNFQKTDDAGNFESNLVNILPGGNVGVGVVVPTAKLQIHNTSTVPNLLLSASPRDIATPTGETLQFGHWDGTTFTERMNIGPTGTLKVNTVIYSGNSNNDCPAGWACNGYFWDISASGLYYSVLQARSDKRLKKNIEKVSDDVILKLLGLNPVIYEWKDPKVKGKKYGFIAQEVENVMPDLVATGSDKRKTKSVDYMQLISPLVKGFQYVYPLINEHDEKIKEFDRTIASQKAEIEKLKLENNYKQQQLDEMKQAICEINPKARICQ